MKRFLIVNADDCNLTAGVTRAILDCHDRGILTSTTFMINLPVARETVRALIRRKHLGVGLHLNVTFGRPVSKPSRVSSLLADGNFKKYPAESRSVPKAVELLREYDAQIVLFKKIFGRLPTHLDTHHQLHDRPFFLKALTSAAQKYRLPIRRSCLLVTRVGATRRVAPTINKNKGAGPLFTEYFFGNLTPAGHWKKSVLETILINLPEGTSEIMCHPGQNDATLSRISSFNKSREVEWKLFRSPELRKLVERQGITLGHYGMLTQ